MRRRIVSGSAVNSTFWAWFTSIAVHLVILTTLGAVKFSWLETGQNQQSIPIAKISQIEKFLQTAHTIPKPKMKRPVIGQLAEKSDKLLSVEQVLGSSPPSKEFVTFNHLVPEDTFSSPGWRILPKVEFFGSFVSQRKVCYVVDCSGSMQGVFRQVQDKLKQSIQALAPDQYFYIIFFYAPYFSHKTQIFKNPHIFIQGYCFRQISDSFPSLN